jgi:hypothetical protein
MTRFAREAWSIMYLVVAVLSKYKRGRIERSLHQRPFFVFQ